MSVKRRPIVISIALAHQIWHQLLSTQPPLCVCLSAPLFHFSSFVFLFHCYAYVLHLFQKTFNVILGMYRLDNKCGRKLLIK